MENKTAAETMPMLSRVTLEHWRDLMTGFKIGEHAEMFRQLHVWYSEPHRHYHTVAHIDACLRQFDLFRALARFPGEAEAALWFHDAIYLPRASDNEARSADLAVQFFAAAGVPPERCARIHAHILATAHDVETRDPDSALVVDVDLSILGQDPATYDQFEHQIREEYRWVPAFVYKRKRIEVLRSFLERPSIYAVDAIRARYEAPARANLQRAIARLAR